MHAFFATDKKKKKRTCISSFTYDDLNRSFDIQLYKKDRDSFIFSFADLNDMGNFLSFFSAPIPDFLPMITAVNDSQCFILHLISMADRLYYGKHCLFQRQSMYIDDVNFHG